MSRYDEPYDYSKEDDDDFNLLGKIAFALVTTAIFMFILAFNSCVTDEVDRLSHVDPAPLNKEVQSMTQHYGNSLSECKFHWYRHLY
jgi:hypothetical protein